MNHITVSMEEEHAFSDLVLNMDELPNTNELLDILDAGIPLASEDIMHPHVAPPAAPAPYGPPDRTTFEGEYGFVIEVNSKDVHKKKFLYSSILNSIYVNMLDKFPVQFNWDTRRLGARGRVRAALVFADAAEAEKRVERCMQHLHERTATEDSIARRSIMPHVLQSSREVNAPGVRYYGDPEASDSWYSVVVDLHKPTAEPCSHAYRFACKTSCSSGINRRATSIIFTLEDDNGVVLGRQMVGVRVCACPRRDMARDEKCADKSRPGKRRLPTASTPSPSEHCLKRVKIEPPAADDLLVLPQLPVPDARIMMTGLEVMLQMLEQAAELTNDTQRASNYAHCIATFKNHLNILRSPNTNN